MPETVRIRRWFDRHLHLRQEKMLRHVLPCTLATQTTGAVVMGNTDPPISTLQKARAYKEEILRLLPEGCDFNPRLALYLTEQITPREVVQGYKEGVWQTVKLYMADKKGEGGTTGSKHGVRNLESCYPVFAAMEEHGIPLLGHFEAVEEDVDEFDREVVSMERDLQPLLYEFPELQIVVEHITDARMASFVAQESAYEIYATVTPHHLIINRNALFRGGLCPIHYCKPVAKREHHRATIRKIVTSGHPRFGAGTDSAPHDGLAKANPCGCAAGIFTPYAPEQYLTVFEEDDALEHFESFMSQNFLHLYGMEPSEEYMTFRRETWTVPRKHGSIYVFGGDKELHWKLAPRD